MNAAASVTVTPVLVAELHVEGERMPGALPRQGRSRKVD